MDNIRLVSATKQKRPSYDFNKMRIGGAIYKNEVLTDMKKINEKRSRKIEMRQRWERAIQTNNLEEMRAISNYFFTASGIYSRLCRYMAYLYRYD